MKSAPPAGWNPRKKEAFVLIILFCVYGISPESTGTLRTAQVRVNRPEFELLLYEEGNSEKKKHCRKAHGKTPDLAWVEIP